MRHVFNAKNVFTIFRRKGKEKTHNDQEYYNIAGIIQTDFRYTLLFFIFLICIPAKNSFEITKRKRRTKNTTPSAILRTPRRISINETRMRHSTNLLSKRTNPARYKVGPRFRKWDPTKEISFPPIFRTNFGSYPLLAVGRYGLPFRVVRSQNCDGEMRKRPRRYPRVSVSILETCFYSRYMYANSAKTLTWQISCEAGAYFSDETTGEPFTINTLAKTILKFLYGTC